METFLRNISRFIKGKLVPPDVYFDNSSKIKAFKNKYAGERCFIIGNGPSLNPDDLEKLIDEKCFAANRIYMIYGKTSWRPSFYCVQDMNVLREMGEDVLSASQCSEATFIRVQSYSIIKDIKNGIKNLILVPIWNKVYKNPRVQFSDKADRFIYDGDTVTYMSIELAAYMGFTDIYLLGVDHSFPFYYDLNGNLHEVDKNLAAHFYEVGEDNAAKGVDRRSNEQELVTLAYESAKEYSQRTNKFKVYNATRGGKLEVFERISLEEALDTKTNEVI